MRNPPACLVLALLLFAGVATDAAASTVAQTVSGWGLMGSWAPDCSAPPARGNTFYTYEPRPNGSVVLLRDGGDYKDESEVISAEIEGERLKLTTNFPSYRHVMTSVLGKTADGYTTITNQDETRAYTIRNGVLTGSGRPAAINLKCQPSVAGQARSTPRP